MEGVAGKETSPPQAAGSSSFKIFAPGKSGPPARAPPKRPAPDGGVGSVAGCGSCQKWRDVGAKFCEQCGAPTIATTTTASDADRLDTPAQTTSLPLATAASAPAPASAASASASAASASASAPASASAAELEALQQKVDRLEQKNAAAEQSLSDLRQLLESEKASSAEQMTVFEEEMKAQHEELQELASQQAVWEETKADFMGQIEKYRERVESADTENKTLVDEINVLKSKATDYKRIMQTMTEQISQLSEANSILEAPVVNSLSTREGWLSADILPKGQSRYFILQGHSLNHQKAPDSARSYNVLRLQEGTVYGSLTDTPNAFAIIPMPGAKKTVFFAASDADRQDWLQSLKQSPGKRKDNTSNAFVNNEGEAFQYQAVVKGPLGKYIKKGSKKLNKFFALYPAGIIKWGDKDSPFYGYKHSATVVGVINGDELTKKLEGFKDTTSVNVDVTFVIQTTGKTLVLVAASKQEAETWLVALDLVVQDRAKALAEYEDGNSRGSAKGEENKDDKPVGGTRSRRMTADAIPPLTGELFKFVKGGKSLHQKYFTLHPDGMVMWGKNAQSLKYSERLESCTALKDTKEETVFGEVVSVYTSKVDPGVRDRMFVCKTTGKALWLLAPSPRALDVWVSFANHVIARGGSRPKQSVVVNNAGSLMARQSSSLGLKRFWSRPKHSGTS